MSVEPLEEVIRKWNNRWINKEQAIGKILLWLQELERRMLTLEARLFSPDGGAARVGRSENPIGP